MHGYLSLDIICSSKLTVFLELRSRKTVRFSEQIMSADKYPCIFSRQMETIVYISLVICVSQVTLKLHYKQTKWRTTQIVLDRREKRPSHKLSPKQQLTSCCGAGNWETFCFYWVLTQALSSKFAIFVKDTTDLINKIQTLNAERGPLPPGCLLVSWDVVAMFPNIDNHLGFSAVRKYLDSRSDKFSSTDCIVVPIEICLQANNCQFSGKDFVQKHGTAMGPKNACSYADLGMGLIDENAKFGGAVKPMLLWRYRDDVFDIWIHDLPKLLEFTEYINSLYPTIKFELVYSEHTLNVLDLTLHLQDGFISTDIYRKTYR